MLRSKVIVVLLVLLAGASLGKQAESAVPGDKQIKKRMIRESIEGYPGNCPCPYNAARNGSRCGGRSAYSRKGGYAPLCFESDITKEMVEDWKQAHTGDPEE